jgi:hypothetical protein
MQRITITVTPEVDSALGILAMQAGMSKSRMVDTLLRQHARVGAMLSSFEAEPDSTAFAVSRDSASKKRR